ncbi:alpha/beta hydrolase [Adhaeribacter sp. BT258]|uniref:Alpha/beta hydrolase n=1 Tax=Adhaeribacter terrigena TaxID=2793070 RepID=A0ABS1BWL7_9BACT|nr:alpha/beta hydrolase [Adhaeribacter terrigena]MBK0401532.1 alpha/beta hydrolase [Adhaeribacter terrigena]
MTTKPAENTLVFLHGFCESTEVWTDFIAKLPEKFHCVALDLPGFGANLEPVKDYSIEAMAEAVHAELKQLHIKKCVLVGHSLGGYVSLAFAEKYPKMLQGMCLFHSSALPDSEEKKEARNKTIEFVKKHGVEVFMDSFVTPLFAPENREKCKTAIEKLKKIGKATPEESIVKTLRAMRDRKKRLKVLQEAAFPVLFIAGKEDGAVPLEATLQQCHLPNNSTTVFLGGTGHMGMFEKPYETRKALEKFAELVFG